MRKITAPRNTTIKGQPHQLAYINDREQGLLMALGGAGKPVHGVPAYYDEGDDYTGPGGDQDANDYMDSFSNDDTDDGGPSNNPVFAEQAAAAAAQAKAALQQSLSQEAYEAARSGNVMANSYANPYANSALTAADMQFNIDPLGYGSADPRRVANSIVNSLGRNGRSIFGPSIYSSQYVGRDYSKLLSPSSWKNALAGKGFGMGGVPMYSSWFDDKGVRQATAQLGIDQMKDRMEQSRVGVDGKVFGGASNFFQQGIIDKLEAGGRPVFDEYGNIQGVFHEQKIGDFSLGEVYSGNPVEGLPETGWNAGGNDAPDVKPVNELTGQCEDGYVYDEDLQACRLAGDANANANAGGNFGVSGETYYRPTALDTASQFQPAGYDFAAGNKAFVDSFAYNPDYYDNMKQELTGYAPVSGLLA